MPISPMDEYLAHQTSETFDHVATSDRNFYDRYYFNCHPSSDELFLVTGMGQYPNLGVTDAFVCISHGDTQYVVRASRELGSDRHDSSVGPFSVEVVEGLQTLRVACAENEWGVEFDLLWRGSVPCLEEPKSFTRRHGRITQDVSRYAQVGTWEGTLRVGGQTYEVTPDRWKGARDHSWGVRPVGDPESPGIRVKDYAEGFGFFHNWMPMQFDDCMIKVTIDEDQHGGRLLEESTRIWNHGIGKEPEDLGTPSVEIDYVSGTREMREARVTFTHPSGRTLRCTNTPLRTVYLFGGSGYRFEDGWGHGVYQGPLKTEGLTYDIGSAAGRAAIAGLHETLCRFDLETGETGWGMHENLIIGVYEPHGFTDPLTMAP
ncbi:MAG: hypothetical protein ACQGVC_05450 [Myxococcota bacterium]